MKPKFTTVERVPCWAENYLYCNDESNLGDGDIELILAFEEKLEREGLRLVSPIGEKTRSEFCANPAFGKACDVEDWVAEVLPPDRIVFRKYWNKWNKAWTPIAFLPDVEVNPGNVMSYEHMGQHGEASMDYYWSTRPCEPELYAPLLKELEGVGYRPRIMKRITRTKNKG